MSRAQTQIINPQTQPTPNSRASVATARSIDTPQGSRVIISYDQSLIDYEAYRQGDKFYLRIPVAEMPLVNTLRGRGFTQVTAQRNGNKILLCFTLQPGAAAHVEQSGNHLDVVLKVPIVTVPVVTANAPRFEASPVSAMEMPRLRNSNAHVSRRNSRQRLEARPITTGTPPATRKAIPTPTPRASQAATTTAAPKTSVTPAQKTAATPNPNSSVAAPLPNSPSQDWWSRMKERGHYWILLAQLNPLPVALGAALLLMIIGLLLLQRRRARATRRVRPVKTKRAKSTAATATNTSEVTAAATTAPKEAAEPSVPVQEKLAEAPAVVPVPAIAPVPVPADEVRKERVSQASEEARKLFAGEPFDERVIGSEDRETRRLVCAELSSALVGRNAERRERAREAFMKYGYFDDATRDLRIAESENERAAAARRLSFVQDREATPHLIGALSDSAPDVRRAAIEALMDLRDPAAIAPLNSLRQRETDRKVPRNLINQAIDACATTTAESSAASVSQSTSAVRDFVPSVSHPAPPSFETEREVIEI